jgi:hypothetical protein
MLRHLLCLLFQFLLVVAIPLPTRIKQGKEDWVMVFFWCPDADSDEIPVWIGFSSVQREAVIVNTRARVVGAEDQLTTCFAEFATD